MDAVEYIESLLENHSDIGAIGLRTSMPREVAEDLTEKGYSVSGRGKEWVVRSKPAAENYQSIPCYTFEIQKGD